jgi:integrating conjugative element protein (TIGR03749 family)
MKRLFYVVCVLSFLSASAFAIEPLPLSDSQIKKLTAYFPTEEDNRQLIWKGDPLSITLTVNAEKRVIFPEPIEANLNGALTQDQLRIINNDQSLYLTALKPFSTIRLYVTLKHSNKIVLLDMGTSDKATNGISTVKIAVANQSTDLLSDKRIKTPASFSSFSSFASSDSLSASSTRASNSLSVEFPAQSEGMGSANTYVNAIRFAWQQLYAPQRLLNQTSDFSHFSSFSRFSNFSRTPMHTEAWVSDLVYGDKVLAHPEVSWMSGDVYVTAIELRNKYPHTTTLNLQQDLCGDWQAATLYPRAQLKPAGDKSGDSATLFLISTKPFGEVLETCHGGA